LRCRSRRLPNQNPESELITKYRPEVTDVAMTDRVSR
jgi:hypothetical protein